MVKIFSPPPPPGIEINPQFIRIQTGTKLLRLYKRSDKHKFSLFRFYGPLYRFDHHQPQENGQPSQDPTRGICYVGQSLSCCLVEVFGDTRLIELNSHDLISLRTCSELKLLDLRGRSAMTAGTVAAINAAAERTVTQPWARYFYSQYNMIDGLCYTSAHNGEIAYVLFERSRRAFRKNQISSQRLDDPSLRKDILRAAKENSMIVF